MRFSLSQAITQQQILPGSDLVITWRHRYWYCLCLPFLTNISYKERLMYVNLLPMCYWHELLDLVYFYKVTHNMIYLDPSAVCVVRECARRTRISVTSSQSFVLKKCRTSTFQKSFFIRTTRIWNLFITRLDLDNVTFENFKSVLHGYYSRALAINYDPNSPSSFKSICLKCNTAKVLDQEISCCMWFKLFIGSAEIGFSCCGVPAQIFKLLLVYCYILIISVCISSVFFFCILQGKANKKK